MKLTNKQNKKHQLTTPFHYSSNQSIKSIMIKVVINKKNLPEILMFFFVRLFVYQIKSVDVGGGDRLAKKKNENFF